MLLLFSGAADINLIVSFQRYLKSDRTSSSLALLIGIKLECTGLPGKSGFLFTLSSKRAKVGSTAVQQYRGTFLVPLQVPSVLFQHSTVFGTVGTFSARLPRFSVLLCGMQLKSFKRSSNYGEALPNLAHAIRSG